MPVACLWVCFARRLALRILKLFVFRVFAARGGGGGGGGGGEQVWSRGGMDGLTVDRSGRVWATAAGGVVVLDPAAGLAEGRHVATIQLGEDCSRATALAPLPH